MSTYIISWHTDKRAFEIIAPDMETASETLWRLPSLPGLKVRMGNGARVQIENLYELYEDDHTLRYVTTGG